MNEIESKEILSKIKHVTPIKDVLSYNINEMDYERMIEDLHSFAQSKYGVPDLFSVSKELVQNNGISVLVCTGETAKVVFLKKYTNVENDFYMNKKDVLILPSHFDYAILDGEYKKYTFKIEEPIKHGNGIREYEVSLNLQDRYFIKVYADSEEEAAEIAYMADMKHWQHEWPKKLENTRIQQSRYSMWDKSMLKVNKVNGENE
jgi:hypothetical protein